MQIKHTTIVAILHLLMLQALTVHADAVMPTVLFGTNTNGIRDMSKQDVELGFNSGVANFSSRYGIMTKLKVYDSEQELMTAFDQGKIDGIFGLPTNILSRIDQLKPQLRAVIYENGQYKFRYLLLVRKADNNNTIERLKGKRISISKFQEIESMFLDTLLLKRRQGEAPQFFSEIISAPNSNITITDLFFGRVDAAIVNENEYRVAMELNPQVAQKIAILEQSEPMLLLVAGIRKTFSDDYQQLSEQASAAFQQSDAGRKAFKLAGMQGLKPITSTELDTLRALKAEYEQLKQANQLGFEQKKLLPIKQNSAQKPKMSTNKLPRLEK